jgi:F1F0 ATPase subunit 2
MTKFHLTEHSLILPVLNIGAWLVVGTLLGALYFLTLRWNIQTFIVGKSPPAAFLIQLIRFSVLAGGLVIISKQFGALPLLVATAGIIAARTAIIRFGVRP